MVVVSSRYARALFAALSADGGRQADRGLAELQGFADVLTREPAARQILLNPAIPADERERFIGKIVAVLELDVRVHRLISLLCDRRRLDILGEVVEAYRQMLDEKNGVARATVTSATALTESEEREITERLGKSVGKRVIVEVEQDPALLGGVVVRIGGKVYDGSLRQRLAGFRARLAAS